MSTVQKDSNPVRRRVIRMHGIPTIAVPGTRSTKILAWCVTFWVVLMPLSALVTLAYLVGTRDDWSALQQGVLYFAIGLFLGMLSLLTYKLAFLCEQYLLRSIRYSYLSLFMEYMIEKDEGFEEFHEKMRVEFVQQLKGDANA